MSTKLFGEQSRIMEREGLFLLIVVIINLIVKALPAGLLELGNDEVYYWTYALFPDWSHFDHPPMVGLTIQLFTLNLRLNSELFIRAGSLILSSANIIILYQLVKKIYSKRAAYMAVCMYVASFYFNIISGLFILPDTPQIFFLLLALYFCLPSVTNPGPTKRDDMYIVAFGFFAGLAFLSKYHSLFIWLGVGVYVLFHNRVWLKKPSLYLSMLITFLLMLPVIYWNQMNDFISFAFHGDRIGFLHNHLNLNSFLQFNLGQFAYQNPVLFVVYTLALIKIFRHIRRGNNEISILLLYLALPLIIVFTILSLFRTTLPHWTGPAFLCMLISGSDYLADLFLKKRKNVIVALSAAIILFFIILLTGTLQINHGIINLNGSSRTDRPGKNDFTLDMFGWKQTRAKFVKFLADEGISAAEHKNIALVSDNWFPAAHIDHYIAYPLKIRLVALGNIENIHKYFWINQTRKLKMTDKIFYITDSRNYTGPEKYKKCFEKIIPKDTLSIIRNHRVVKNVYISQMIGLKVDSSLYSPHPEL